MESVLQYLFVDLAFHAVRGVMSLDATKPNVISLRVSRDSQKGAEEMVRFASMMYLPATYKVDIGYLSDFESSFTVGMVLIADHKIRLGLRPTAPKQT